MSDEIFYAMDIETNTLYNKELEKGQEMYKPCAVWMYLGCIKSNKGEKTFFHSWEEYRSIISKIKKGIIFVHNLSYEFDYMAKNGFNFSNIVANKAHHIIKCEDVDCGIEYRCTFMISRKSLAKIGKLVGRKKLEYDYSGIRCKNNLTDKDYEYNENDVDIVIDYVNMLLKEYKKLKNLPLTQTSRVRKVMRDNDKVFYNEFNRVANKFFPDENQYKLMEQAFTGAFTYGNPQYFGQILDNVYSADRISAYPAEMLENNYPYKWTKIYTGDEAVKKYNENNTFIFNVTFKNIRSIDNRLNVLSISKCNIKTLGDDILSYNGKLVFANTIEFTLDSVNFSIVKKCYKWDNMTINKYMEAMIERRVPRTLLQTVIKFATDKQKLKPLVKENPYDEELNKNYMTSKEMLNSIYGTQVMKFTNTEYTVNSDGEWLVNYKEYEKPKNLMRMFSIGLFVTSYARKQLIEKILENGIENFVYCDTDSIKSLNYFEDSNKYLSNNSLIRMNNVSRIDVSQIENFGMFENENTTDKPIYEKFAHYGAKKYAYIRDGEFHFVISGVPKSENSPKSFDDLKAGKVYEKVKNGHAFVLNTYYNKMYYKDSNGNFNEYQGKIKDRGGIAIVDADYTFGISSIDSNYVKQYGINIKSYNTEIEVENIEDNIYNFFNCKE